VILPETAKGGRNGAAGKPTKNWPTQAAISTHLSQSTGAGAFDGQQGMSPAISSSAPDIDISAIEAIDGSDAMPAMTGLDSGASTIPTIALITKNRDRSRCRTMPQSGT
jgi:hypothetical protein